MNNSVKDIIRRYLKRNKYDGLYNPYGDCGCEVDDLMHCCCECIEGCTPGYKVPYNPETCLADGDYEWHIGIKNED